jgi:hypothetical protein
MSTLSTHVDTEEIQTTKSEKLLAVVLAAFLLVGALWSYQKVDDAVRSAVEHTSASATDRAAIDRLDAAARHLGRAEQIELAARDQMELAREAYRTALDGNQPAGGLERAYVDAQEAYERAQASVAAAQVEVEAARPPAEAAQERVDAEQRRAARLESLGSFGLRMLLVLTSLGASFALLGPLRAAGSRYLPLGLAAVGFSSVFAFVMAGDYVTDYVDPLEFGPLVLAAVGIGLTLLAFVGLQRYLQKRIPQRRVRKGECPFCGFPGRGKEHCEGCGRTVVGECSTCSAPRRVGAQHCGTCGAV